MAQLGSPVRQSQTADELAQSQSLLQGIVPRHATRVPININSDEAKIEIQVLHVAWKWQPRRTHRERAGTGTRCQINLGGR
jgi:hypothetical protein